MSIRFAIQTESSLHTPIELFGPGWCHETIGSRRIESRAAILQNPENIQCVQDVKLSHEVQAFMDGPLILCDRLEIPCTNISFELE